MLTNIIAMGDNHGHLACDDTLDAIMEGVARYKPKYRVHLGDNWDMTCLRKGIEHNSKEAIDNLREDLDAGIHWIRRYRPTHFLFGNSSGGCSSSCITPTACPRLARLRTSSTR